MQNIQQPTLPAQLPGEGAEKVTNWREEIRRMELKCAETWMESAKYWRGEAARALAANNPVLASECLLNAVIRESYAHEDLVKATALTPSLQEAKAQTN